MPCSKAKQSFKFQLFSSPSPFTRVKLTQLNWSCQLNFPSPFVPAKCSLVFLYLFFSGHSFSHTHGNPSVFWEKELAESQNLTVHTANINALWSISFHTSALLQLSADEFASLGATNRNCQHSLPCCRSPTACEGFTDTVWRRDVNEPTPALKFLKDVNLFADRI